MISKQLFCFNLSFTSLKYPREFLSVVSIFIVKVDECKMIKNNCDVTLEL